MDTTQTDAKRRYAHRRAWLFASGSVAVIIAFFTFFPFSSDAHSAVSLTPEQVGIGQGVAACISSAPAVTCDTSGNNVYTFSYNESAHGAGNVYVGIIKVSWVHHEGSSGENFDVPAYDTYSYVPVTGYSASAIYTAQFSANGGYPASTDAYGQTGTYYVAAVAPSQSSFNTGGFYDSKKLPAPLSCTAPPSTWTTYCTGGSDPNGNNWQWWQYDNSSPPNYRFLRNGDGTCTAASLTPPTSISAACSASGTAADISWPTSNGATQYQVSVMPQNGYIGSCPTASGWSLYTDPNNGHTLCYQQTSNQSLTFPSVVNATPYYTWVSPYNTASGWNWNNAPVTNFTCYSIKPASGPTTVSHSCSASGTPVTLSWSSVPTATTYAASIFLIPNTTPCPATWSDNGIVNGTHACQASTAATAITFAVPPGTDVNSYIYAGNSAGYNPVPTPTLGEHFTCSPPPTAALSASPTTVVSGSKTTLTWTSENTTSCTAAGGFSTGGSTGGSASSIPLPATPNPATFQVICQNANGDKAIANASVTVTSPAVTISASPTRTLSDNKTTVSWTATDVDSCDITRNDKPWKTGLSGSDLNSSSPDTISGQTVYKITCNDASAKAHAASVVVNTGAGGFQEF